MRKKKTKIRHHLKHRILTRILSADRLIDLFLGPFGFRSRMIFDYYYIIKQKYFYNNKLKIKHKKIK